MDDTFLYQNLQYFWFFNRRANQAIDQLIIFNCFYHKVSIATEKEVAWLLIKGLSIQEIADARNTKIGTVKSQSNAVYQKAGLQGRAELVSYFVEDLLA